MFSYILNIVSTNLKDENETKQMDTDAFDFQAVRSVVQSFYVSYYKSQSFEIGYSYSQ